MRRARWRKSTKEGERERLVRNGVMVYKVSWKWIDFWLSA